ncbi:hypothetical protein BMS3Bbin07_00895 [bacterium BMS3Bbin07]|nr:hypothetical protein BMS3Bbin07_00895 [bacterium BMS3Bbin07]
MRLSSFLERKTVRVTRKTRKDILRSLYLRAVVTHSLPYVDAATFICPIIGSVVPVIKANSFTPISKKFANIG